MTGRTVFSRNAMTILVVAVLVASLFGCVSIKRPALKKEYFLLEAARPGTAQPPRSDVQARVKFLGVSSAFSAKPFVYRLDDHSYTTDFYREFLISPGEQIDVLLRAWLASAGLVAPIPSSASPEGVAGFLLTFHVPRIFVDFRDRQNPEAVIELKAFVSREKSGVYDLQKEYIRRESLGGREAGDIMAGWDRALASILSELEADLEAAMKKSGGQ